MYLDKAISGTLGAEISSNNKKKNSHEITF